MALKWYCKGKKKDYGPFSFQDLVKFIRAGRLTEDHLVKREHSTRWMKARDVVGLFQVAIRPEGRVYAGPEEARQEESDDATSDSRSTTDSDSKLLELAAAAVREPHYPSGRKRLVTRRRVVFALTTAVLLVATAVFGLRARENRRFPRSAADEGVQSEYTLELLRITPPEPVSVPGLEVGVPELVPGLQSVGDIYCLCLSADLKTLAFSGAKTINDTHDLYITSRGSILVPFDEPVRVDNCSSDAWEINPCLSADGLELFFVRPESREHFFRSARSGAHSDFGPPLPWPKRGSDSTLYKVGYPRLMGADRLIFNAEAEGERHFVFMAKREKSGKLFGSPRLTYLLLTEARSIVSADGMRAYYGTSDGLFLSGRQSEKEGFSRGFEILPAETTGPVETPVWMTPQEDVIFYCSPGPDEEPGTARKAWLVRI